jgi:putative hemolysin
MTAISSSFPAARALDPSKHIVDVLIEERAPTLSSGPAWPVVRPLLYLALNYAKARRMADAISTMGGRDALDYIAGLLSLRLDVRGLDRLPTSGRCVVIANHPTGIADGIAVYSALKPRRPDICFMANADAHRVCPRFGEALIPVEWAYNKRTIEKTKQTLRAAQAAFTEERPLMIFPAGRLARRIDGRIQDPDWETSAVSLARKHAAPIIPIHVAGPYPFFFHTFDRISKELRDITLFHELLNKKGSLFTLKVGRPISGAHIAGDPGAVTTALKRFIEQDLECDGDAEFTASVEAPPKDRAELPAA